MEVRRSSVRVRRRWSARPLGGVFVPVPAASHASTLVPADRVRRLCISRCGRRHLTADPCGSGVVVRRVSTMHLVPSKKCLSRRSEENRMHRRIHLVAQGVRSGRPSLARLERAASPCTGVLPTLRTCPSTGGSSPQPNILPKQDAESVQTGRQERVCHRQKKTVKPHLARERLTRPTDEFPRAQKSACAPPRELGGSPGAFTGVDELLSTVFPGVLKPLLLMLPRGRDLTLAGPALSLRLLSKRSSTSPASAPLAGVTFSPPPRGVVRTGVAMSAPPYASVRRLAGQGE